MSILKDYLTRLREIRSMGMATDETSYYTPLENLLNGIGNRLSPRVIVTAQLSAASQALVPRGVESRSFPDFGFFVQENQDLRGLIEAKGADVEVHDISRRPQIAKYLRVVPAVLITNYREFLFVTKSSDGSTLLGPNYSIAASEEQFWNTPVAKLVSAHESGLRTYLEHILQHSSPIFSADELALVLARYAAESKRRIELQPENALDPLRIAMTDALGITFPGAKGEAFFRSSLIQTLFYGLFSAWIVWVKQRKSPEDRFEWEEASGFLNVAVVGALFEAIATNRRLRTLDLADPVRWAEDALNRVDIETFFTNFEQEHAIQYFYEPFLEAYDPALRKELGVWYTPPEVVEYQIARIDQLLRSDLGIASGLADERVIILDPCTGTGSYLLEAAKTIYRLFEADEPSLAAARTKEAITTRLFGFEIMPAPFVIAHLQMGFLSSALGSSLNNGERAAIYLTNALTNWEAAGEPKQTSFPELAEEREAAERVKREERILVVVGNPPYWRYTSMAIGEEADLIAPYKEGLYQRFRVRKSTIDDLYIRFYRLGEWRIAEQETHRGIVSFISNWSWLAGSSFPVMRERLLHNFDSIYIDNLGGSIRGRDRRIEEDESVFKTEWSPGITLGVSISFLVVKGIDDSSQDIAETSYRRLFGRADEKRRALLQSIEDNNESTPYTLLTPAFDKKWVLRPSGESEAYDSWVSLSELLPVRESGVNENRGGALISIDRQPLEELRTAYMDSSMDYQQVAQSSERAAALMQNRARYNPSTVRAALLRPGQSEPPRIVRYALKPFDDRWLLWAGEKLLNEKRKDFLRLVDNDDVAANQRNVFLVACENARVVYDLPGVTTFLGDLHYQDPWAQFFPIRNKTQATGFIASVTRPNLNEILLAFLSDAWEINSSEPHEDATPEEMILGESIFYHVLATMHTPSYREAHEEALTNNWARIPIPSSQALLEESAELGRRIAELLRTDLQPEGVITGEVPPSVRLIAQPKRVDGGQLRAPHDFGVTVNYRGAGRVISRSFTENEIEVNELYDFGEDTNDVYWNVNAYWSNIPSEVWEFHIGGFPVLRKWLEDRRYERLGRELTANEIQNFSFIARRIVTLLSLGDELDACHEMIAASELVILTD